MRQEMAGEALWTLGTCVAFSKRIYCDCVTLHSGRFLGHRQGSQRLALPACGQLLAPCSSLCACPTFQVLCLWPGVTGLSPLLRLCPGGGHPPGGAGGRADPADGRGGRALRAGRVLPDVGKEGLQGNLLPIWPLGQAVAFLARSAPGARTVSKSPPATMCALIKQAHRLHTGPPYARHLYFGLVFVLLAITFARTRILHSLFFPIEFRVKFRIQPRRRYSLERQCVQKKFFYFI